MSPGPAAGGAFGVDPLATGKFSDWEKMYNVNVLGMNFLSSLSSWGVEGQWLVLKP